MSKLQAYKNVEAALPCMYQAWQIFGAGFENVGRDGRPTTLKLREPSEDEVLCRVDALGLCLSDIKIINQGNQHPRLRGRDLAVDPTVLGHECSVTIIWVGERWREQFEVGERYIVQADIYFKGMNYAFGYLIPGGLAQYCYLDERALAGDEGCYLLPVNPEIGYSQAALAEPWACVEMSYNVEDRLAPGDGDMLIVDDGAGACSDAFPNARVLPPTLDGLAEDDTFDDIIVAKPEPAVVERLVPHLRKNGALFLLGSADGAVSVDVGRVHYEGIRLLGGGDTVEAVTAANQRTDLLPDGAALFIGAGGPMGQMHVQRAIEVPCGSRRVVVTDLDPERLDHIRDRFGGMAEAKSVELLTLSPEEGESPAAFNERVQALSPNGYNDVCVLAPVPALVTAAMAFAADNALVNLFAGIPIGNPATFDVSHVCRGVKIIGSSGSRIRDLRKILDMVEKGELNTDLSVAAIGGLNVAREGLEGVKAGRFPGKTVIYTQIPDLPLIALPDIPKQLPEIADKLAANGAWSKEAEAALLETHLS